MHFRYSIHPSRQYFLKDTWNHLFLFLFICLLKVVTLLDWYFLFYSTKNREMVAHISFYCSWHSFRIHNLFPKIWSMHVALAQETFVDQLVSGGRPFWKEVLIYHWVSWVTQQIYVDITSKKIRFIWWWKPWHYLFEVGLEPLKVCTAAL